MQVLPHVLAEYQARHQSSGFERQRETPCWRESEIQSTSYNSRAGAWTWVLRAGMSGVATYSYIWISSDHAMYVAEREMQVHCLGSVSDAGFWTTVY